MKFRLPLTPRTVDDIACAYPRVVLQVRDRYGALAPIPFRIDCGADFIALPVTQRGLAAGLVGSAVKFRDRIHVVIGGREHEWPCDFIDVPQPITGRIP